MEVKIMFNSNTGFSMPVMPAYGNNNGGFGFGSDWIGLIVILAILGWGGNGFGGGFGGFGGGRNGYVEPCATQADVRAAVDQQTLISKIDEGVYGQANTAFTMNNTIMNGFHGVDNAICTLGYQNQQGFNNLGHQLSDCCCTTQRAIDGVNYNMATQACDTRRAISDSTRDIIDNQNANSRQLLDFLVNDKLATLQAENQNLKLQASQAAQNAYLLNELKPCPQPAYITCNPFTGQYGGYGNCGCGCV